MSRTGADSRLIDTHAHWVTPAYVSELRRLGGEGIVDPIWGERFAGGSISSPGAGELLSSMDQAGIGTAVVSIPPPGIHGRDVGEANPAAAALVNDELVSLAESAGDRFRVWLTLPMPDPRASMNEIERLGRHPLVVGVGLYSHSRPWCLDQPDFEPMFRLLVDHGLVAQLHPSFEAPEPRFAPFALGGSLDAVYVNGLVAARLIYSGLFDRVPQSRLLVTHLGGTLPFLAQRIHDMSGPSANAHHDIFHYCRTNLWYDNCSYHTPALACTADSFGPDRVVLGSDFPFRGPIMRCVDDIRRGGFDARTEEAMSSTTARHLFPRDRPPKPRTG